MSDANLDDDTIAGFIHAMLGATLWPSTLRTIGKVTSDAHRAATLRPFILALRPEIRKLVAEDELMPLPPALREALRRG